MHKWLLISLASMALCCRLSGAEPLERSESNAPIKIGVVNFKVCVEESKIGKQEQASFEAMKKQMESVVEEKEKVLGDLANKLNNPDELDLMSPEAETELKRKFRALSQEMSQLQSQFYQTLNQANFQVVQKISEMVTKASEKVAKALNLDLVLNDESCFFTKKDRDISPLVTKEMDRQFDEEAKDKPPAQAK